MYIDVDTIIKIAGLITALGVIVGGIIAVYKLIESNKQQSKDIATAREENTIICYGLKCVLQGVIELGADGPCKEALNMLEKHLNKSAHKTDL